MRSGECVRMPSFVQVQVLERLFFFFREASNLMSWKFFRIPVACSEPFEGELNGFLRSHRVLAVERQFVAQGENSFWAFSVEFLDSIPSSATKPVAQSAAGKPRIDYREKLSTDDFAVFAQLRQLRKELAAAEAVPIYVVLTNEHMAQIVEKRASTLATLAQIDGLGEARLQKYGPRLVEFLERQWNVAPAGK